MQQRTKSSEPLWWLPFAGGMMIDALVMPVLIVLTGVLLPLGMLSADGLRGLFDQPLLRFALFVVIAMTFFHAAHRIRFVLPDLGLRFLSPVLPFLCYGGAIVGTLVTAAVALRIL